MITKNYYGVVGYNMCGQSGYCGIVTVGGRNDTVYNGTATSSALVFPSKISTAITSSGIVLGDGNAAPTINDYKLDGNVITTVKLISISTASAIDTGDEYICQKAFIVQNTGEEPITVREVGWVATINYASSAGGSYLLDRTVLDSPVTIPAGCSAEINYTISVKYDSTVST